MARHSAAWWAGAAASMVGLLSLAPVGAAQSESPATSPSQIAAHEPVGPANAPPASEPTRPRAERLSVTHHSMQLDGQTLDYDATAGTMQIKDDADKPRADFFFIAYTKTPPEEPTTRPITFVFNGGPGSAAVWLHLGAVGPRRVELGEDGIPGPPPHRLIDNDQTWLDRTDLVFVDPIGTGFSRPAEGHKLSEFTGAQHDTSSMGEFIRLYLTRYQRWDSPKFLAGESYGTTRAALLASYLLSRYGIDLNGIILVSTVLNFQTLEPSTGNELPYALYLPSYTAIAVYHHKLQTDDEAKLLDDVSQWAMHDYLVALAKGGALSPAERGDVINHLSQYTSLPPDLIDRTNLRIDPSDFRKWLLRDQRKIIGRFDARITGLETDPAHVDTNYDPSFSLFFPVYSSTFNDYVRRSLKYETDLTYEVLTGKVFPWDFGGQSGMGYFDATDDLRQAMTENPHLKVLVCSGYEDLATPYLATKYTFDHLDLGDRLQANVTQMHYESGHMIYNNPQMLKKLKTDVVDFMNEAIHPGP